LVGGAGLWATIVACRRIHVVGCGLGYRGEREKEGNDFRGRRSKSTRLQFNPLAFF
jgi:hypothetical protein